MRRSMNFIHQRLSQKFPIKLSIYDLLTLLACILTFCMRLFFLQFSLAINPDGTYYCWSARHLLEGKGYTIGYSEIPEVRVPLYPLFIALFFLIFGINHYSAKLVSIVFGSLSIPVLYLLMKSTFKNEKTAFWAAFLLAINPLFIAETDFELGGVYREGLSAFILLLSIFFTIKAKDEGKYAHFLLVGLLSGVFYLIRPEGLYLLLFQIFYFLLIFVDRRQIELIKKLSFTVTLAGITILPWLIRDYLTFGVFNREGYFHGAFFFLREFGTQPPNMMLNPLDYLVSYHSAAQLVIGSFIGFYRLWSTLFIGLTPLGFFLFVFGFITGLKRKYLFFHLLLLFYLILYGWPAYVWSSIVPRYLVILIPVCMLFAGQGLSEFEKLLAAIYLNTITIPYFRITNRRFQQLIILGVLLITTTNSLIVSKDIIIDEQYEAQLETFKTTGQWLKSHTAPDSLIFTNFPALIERYSGRTTFDLKKANIQEILETPYVYPVYIVVDSTVIQSDVLIEMYLYATYRSVVWYSLSVPNNVKCVYVLGGGSWHPYDIAVYKKVEFA